MLLQCMFVLMISRRLLLAERLIIYNNARFDREDIQSQLIDIFPTNTKDTCICRCLMNTACITINFIGINETCFLFNTPITQGEIRVMLDSSATVITLPDRIMDTNNTSTMIEWLFDGNLNDVYDHYNGELIDDNTVSWISPGYNGYGSASYFPFQNYSRVDYYLNLTSISFTISAWIMIPYKIILTDRNFFTFFGHCEYTNQDYCLHIAILDGKIYFGLYGDDLFGNTQMNSNQWYHVAYVYDHSTLRQMIYLNGILDGYRTAGGSYKGNARQLILGSMPQFTWETYNNGYVDKLTFVSRIKSASEIVYEATLVAYYSFDNTYFDFGPNQINNSSAVNTSFTSFGRYNQALMIQSMYLSYFQTTGFYYLGQTNYSYSFSLWIYPCMNNGTILQISSSNGWCLPIIGFNSIGELTIQTLSDYGLYTMSLVNRTLPLNSWTHITMTYSMINGIQLFINGSLANFNHSLGTYLASGQFCTIIIGSGLEPNLCTINNTKIVPTQFGGAIDELKIYSRELSTSEISQLASF